MRTVTDVKCSCSCLYEVWSTNLRPTGNTSTTVNIYGVQHISCVTATACAPERKGPNRTGRKGTGRWYNREIKWECLIFCLFDTCLIPWFIMLTMMMMMVVVWCVQWLQSQSWHWVVGRSFPRRIGRGDRWRDQRRPSSNHCTHSWPNVVDENYHYFERDQRVWSLDRRRWWNHRVRDGSWRWYSSPPAARRRNQWLRDPPVPLRMNRCGVEQWDVRYRVPTSSSSSSLLLLYRSQCNETRVNVPTGITNHPNVDTADNSPPREAPVVIPFDSSLSNSVASVFVGHDRIIRRWWWWWKW